MEKKANQLLDRLKTCKGQMKKIDECTQDMDGNNSNEEEDDFIEAIREEMPDVFKQINSNFGSLDGFLENIKKVKSNPTHADLQKLKDVLA